MTQTVQSIRFATATVRTKVSVLSRFVQAYAGWQQRKHLATLDDARLDDIGLTRAQARAEAARPVWNAHDQWLR